MTASILEEDWGERTWRHNTAVGRWYGLGRWYAMSPPQFAREAILNLSSPGDLVIDPFCGRGNAPFAATVLGRASFGIDIHPLAWLWTAVKLGPEPNPERVLQRLSEIGRAVRPQDRRGRTQFERMAWAPPVRAFLRTARRELDWKESVTDRTLMAFVALHAQDKVKDGLSNQLSPTVAFSPTYAVRWWIERGLTRPPDVEPVKFLTAKIRRRYQFGAPQPNPRKRFTRRCRRCASGVATVECSTPNHVTPLSWGDRLLERPLATSVAARVSNAKELEEVSEVQRGSGLPATHRLGVRGGPTPPRTRCNGASALRPAATDSRYMRPDSHEPTAQPTDICTRNERTVRRRFFPTWPRGEQGEGNRSCSPW